MEKYAEFRDPVSGVNPFMAQKYKPITFMMLLRACFKLPVYLLFLLGFPTLPFLIRINIKNKTKPAGLVFANCVEPFGKSIIKHIYGIVTVKRPVSGTCVIFPENTSTNNRAILNFYAFKKCDYYIGMRFTDGAVFLYGSWFGWLIRFLGSSHHVDVSCMKADDGEAPLRLAETAGLPLSTLDFNDKNKFMKLLK